MRLKYSFLTLLLVCISTVLSAQNGFIRGKVIDDATGEELIGVTVLIQGTTKGAVTDFDGAFQISIEPGTYDLNISFVSFNTITITGVDVVSGEATVIDGIRMKESVEELEAVVVTAEVIRNSEAALLTVKRKSTNVLDGISSQSFRKMGDGNAAAAVKRVTGVSVQDGKYVYVRGLGDRYTKSILNGMDVPGLDPNRNTLQMDIFPTNVVNSIVVMKSFTADLPADFTGGVVNVETKDFPEEKTLNVSAGISYNPSMHFQSDYLSSENGGTDWLGFDNGAREIPTGRSENIPLFSDVVGNASSTDGQQYRNILENFNKNLAAQPTTNFMDYSLGISAGNQKSFDKYTLGYNLALSYKYKTNFYKDAIYSRYGIEGDPSVFELDRLEHQKGNFGESEVLLGGLAGLALKTNNAKYKFNLLHLQNGQSKAGIFEYIGSDLGSNFEAIQHNIEYSQRSLTNGLLSGTFYSEDKTWQYDASFSPTFSKIEDPDIRFTRFRTDNGGYSIGTESGIPERIWRFLDEINLSSKAQATKEYKWFERDAKLKFGVGHTYKNRNYEIQGFQIIPRPGNNLSGNPDDLFAEENLWPTNENEDQGTTYDPGFIPNNPNLYDASVNNYAAFVSNEFSIQPKLKSIVGVRMEKYTQTYTGSNQQGLTLVNEPVIDDLDFFPSLNLIYSLTETQNFRASYSSTIARPSFRESSYANIVDPISGRTFIGGFAQDIDVNDPNRAVIWDGNLQATRINNFDLRWELFQKRGQTFSVSGFYKSFDAPIEIVQFVQAPNSFQPRNVGDGKVLGLELEARQNFGFIAPELDVFSMNANVTIADSKIEMSPSEYNSRINIARDGQEIANERNMAGQSPLIVNAGISYAGRSNGLEAGIFYNMQSETLTYVGIANIPDVYTVPFHALNFNASYTTGAKDHIKIGFGVDNILNDDKEFVYRAYNAEDQLFSRLSPGREFSLSFGYSF